MSKINLESFKNSIKDFLENQTPKKENKYITIYDIYSSKTQFSNDTKLYFQSVSSNPYYKDEGTMYQKMIVIPIKINNNCINKIQIQLLNQDNKKNFLFLNERLNFCNIKSNSLLNYKLDINNNITLLDKKKMAYVIFKISNVSKNLPFDNDYSLQIKSNINGKDMLLHEYSCIIVKSKRKSRSRSRFESFNLPSKRLKISNSKSTQFEDLDESKKNQSTIKSFSDFVKLSLNLITENKKLLENSIKLIESLKKENKKLQSKNDNIGRSLKKVVDKINKFEKDLNHLNSSNVNTISINCFNNENKYPKFPGILPSFGLEVGEISDSDITL